ncbi:methylmalonyl-CoA epimerase [candidate division KSB1 bacterium]|nr:methylmalonyl-CoA epimerase [candidate division KSB1 bacterium]
MLLSLDHIGIAVSNLREAEGCYTRIFGVPASGHKRVDGQGVRIALFELGGIKIELLEATDETSPIAKFISKRGEGIHHIAWGVKDLETVLERLKKTGVVVIDEKPKVGASGRRIAFLSPKSAHGMLIELVEIGGTNG